MNDYILFILVTVGHHNSKNIDKKTASPFEASFKLDYNSYNYIYYGSIDISIHTYSISINKLTNIVKHMLKDLETKLIGNTSSYGKVNKVSSSSK